MSQYLGVSQIETNSVSVTGGVCGPGVDSANTHLSFDLPLRTSLIPKYCRGSATPTFSRSGQATVIDHEGLVRPCLDGEARFGGARRVFNRCATSSEVFAATGSVTITASQLGPDGITLNASKVVCAASGSGNRASIADVGDGYLVAPTLQYVTCSVWLKGLVGGEQIVLSNGWSETVTLTLTTSWTRYTQTNLTGRSSHNIHLYAASGTPTFFAAQGQIETVTGSSVTAPSEYVSIGVASVPYHGANVDGVKYFETTNGNTVTSNVVTHATGTQIAESTLVGLLAEDTRTNRVLYSSDLGNAAWVKSNITVTTDNVQGPSGGVNADKLQATLANGTVLQTMGVVASATKRIACWVKSGPSNIGNIQLTLDNGTSWTTQPSNSSTWTYIGKEQILANEIVGFRLTNNNDIFYIWGVHLENGPSNGTTPTCTSYIPTDGTAVTRNNDTLSYASSNNMSDTAGTAIVSFAERGSEASTTAAILSNSTAVNAIFRRNGGNNVSSYDGTGEMTRNTNLDGVHYLYTLTWDGSTRVLYQNGASTSGSYDGAFNIGTDLYVCNTYTVANIKHIKIYTCKMPILSTGHIASQVSG